MCRARRSAQNVGAERERPCAAVCNFQLQIMIPHPGKPRTIFPSPPVFIPREEPRRAAERRGVRAARLRAGGVPGVRTSVRRPDIAGAGAGRDGAVRKGGA